MFQAGGQDCLSGGGQFGESGVWPGNPGEGLDTFVNTSVTATVCIYGRKSVDRIANQSMSKICNLWRLIVGDCDYAES